MAELSEKLGLWMRPDETGSNPPLMTEAQARAVVEAVARWLETGAEPEIGEVGSIAADAIRRELLGEDREP